MGLIAERIRTGDRLALSRLITQIENKEGGYQQELDLLYPHTGRAHIIGITGPSGSGKSTLVNRLAGALRNDSDHPDRKIGIIAVDPTSPFTGGALLGDRVRMHSLSNDPNFFIRSMATRGALGAIAQATDNTVMAMDAAGFDPIIVETVGAGQSEVEIAGLAHTTIVVEAPGLGDDVQAAKAGILEIADILVVNKADKPAAQNTAMALERMFAIGKEILGEQSGVGWSVPIVKTSALHNEGIDELANWVRVHHDYLRESGTWKIRSAQRLNRQVRLLLREVLLENWEAGLDQGRYDEIMSRVTQRACSPHQAVQMLLD